MKCPHCLVSVHVDVEQKHFGGDMDGAWYVLFCTCPACERFVFWLECIKEKIVQKELLAYPRGIARAPLSSDVPQKYAEDYNEACAVLADSPKASAALGRRCLQALLHDVANVKHQALSKEIDEVLSIGALPTHLADGIDAIRNLGNFATHPIKSTNTGAIVEVEPGEAEWLLDVLEGLFDFYFVAPAELKRKRDALNQKLSDAGKSPMR